jgi:4,5-DOPA dioxygenase extradiol
MPVLFIGHGNPMNAIATNPYTESLSRLGREIPRPKAILCVAAHWMSEGTWVTHQKSPRTIHDFYGFPPELFAVTYPVPGDPGLAERVAAAIPEPRITLDDELWGIDHGTWAILRHMYPKADVPTIQLSIYMERPAPYHYALGRELRRFRDEGVLIVGSGNIVHNLRTMNWDEQADPYPWAREFDGWVRDAIVARSHLELVEDYARTEEGRLSVPSPDHYYPLLYALGASYEDEKIHFEHESIDNASISMRSVSFGLAKEGF